MSTVDLLLSLGGQLADAVPELLRRAPASEQSRSLPQVAEQYRLLQGVYAAIRQTVTRYNTALSRAMTTGHLRDLFELCSPEYYPRVEDQLRGLHQHQISFQAPDAIRLLSISLTSNTTEALRALDESPLAESRAEVFTHEVWTTTYQNGSQAQHSTINRYTLTWAGGRWKMSSNEVFTQAL